MRPRLVSAIVSGLAVLAIAACGSSGGSSSNGVASKSPDQIVAAATNAVSNVNSVHVAGSVPNAGQQITLDLTLVNGKGGKGSMTENGLSFQIVALGQEVYINGSSSFWTKFGGAPAAQLLSGKWLKAPATGQLASLATLTNGHKLFGQLLSSHGKLEKGKTTTIQGQPGDPDHRHHERRDAVRRHDRQAVPDRDRQDRLGRRSHRVQPLQSAGHAHGAGERDRHLEAEVIAASDPRSARSRPRRQ